VRKLEEHAMDKNGPALYLLPVCRRCGHSVCPCCLVWCDRLVSGEESDDEMCCDGECDLHEGEAVERIAAFDAEALYG
jgi:hypothetical protein